MECDRNFPGITGQGNKPRESRCRIVLPSGVCHCCGSRHRSTTKLHEGIKAPPLISLHSPGLHRVLPFYSIMKFTVLFTFLAVATAVLANPLVDEKRQSCGLCTPCGCNLQDPFPPDCFCE
ncbi:hypothetical protein BV22DRAFT_648510 [Leucogyrophana mollusca]|uniref:Uncharacterized protein n=1 Tax=Leucogyrophana mollusca TaxID=85980 RepID=A0ACB8B9Q9_9AGAM|nr:hypothetical protein BV22DRAFT_648510 [Leucogyrophana mollusca]